MYKGDLKRLVLGYAERIQSTFTMGEAFGAIKEADNRSEVSNAISELYRERKLARRRTNNGNSFTYALPAFAPAAFEMYEKPLSDQPEPQKPQKPQDSPGTYIEQKTNEIRTAADKEEAKPAESLKTPEFVPAAERKEERNVWDKVTDEYVESINQNVPDTKIDVVKHVEITSVGSKNHVHINLPINSKLTLAVPNGLNITLEYGAQ